MALNKLNKHRVSGNVGARVCAGVQLSLLIAIGNGCSERDAQNHTDPALSNVDSGSMQRLLDIPLVATNSPSSGQVVRMPPGETNGQMKLMSIWRSTNSTPQQRVDAVGEWLPKQITVEAAKSLLGGEGRLSRYFGPSIHFSPDTNGGIVGQTGEHDYWQLEYEEYGVALRFYLEPGGPNPRWRFDKAYTIPVTRSHDN